MPEALAIHGVLIEDHGGLSGVRDRALLESALARPRQRQAYSNPDICDLAAVYTFGIVRNHPFIDGNKRVGFLVGALFLELNGLRLIATEAEATRAVMDLASGDMDELHYAAWLRSNSAADP